ncbi:MAG: TIGR03936 family radical SAM-associated protein [Planctomycetota bacterium]
MRIQVKFIKQGSLRFISHHNLMKLFERAIRRAGISVKMSEGFNPRPKIAYPLALPVGIKGLDEKLDMELCEWMEVSEIETKLKKQLPENLQVTSVEPLSNKVKPFVKDVIYVVKPKTGKMPEAEKIDELLSKNVLNTHRKGKKLSFNIRSSINNITTNSQTIVLDLKMTPKGMARPEEVLLHLGLKVREDYEISEIVRKRVNLVSSPESIC